MVSDINDVGSAVIFRVFLLSLILTGCAGTTQNCGLFERGSSEFRHCRAEEGSKEYQFRVGMEYFVAADYATAREWLSKAARNKVRVTSNTINPSGSGFRDRIYRDERNIEEEGNEAASFMMARIYRDGLGARQDSDLAQRYMSAAGRWVVIIEESAIGHTIRIKSRPMGAMNDDSLHELYSFELVK